MIINEAYEEMVKRARKAWANLSDDEREKNKALFDRFLEGDAAFRKLAEMREVEDKNE